MSFGLFGAFRLGGLRRDCRIVLERRLEELG